MANYSTSKMEAVRLDPRRDALSNGRQQQEKSVDASEQDAQTFLDNLDTLADRLRAKRRPQDAGAPECSPRELRTLAALGQRGRVTMSTLAQTLDVPLSTATRTVEGLVRKDLVERAQSSDDGRVVEVGFSRRGKTINDYVAGQRRTAAQALLEGLPENERKNLLEALAAIAWAAQSAE